MRRPSDLVLGAGDRRQQDRRLHSVAPAVGTWPEGFASTGQDRTALTVLLRLASLTPRRMLGLAAECGTASRCLTAVRLGRAGSPADRETALREDPERAVDALQACGARLVAVGDGEYPAELLDLSDPPAGIFVRGGPLPDLRPRLSIVGARDCSPAGREVTARLAAAAAGAGWSVVSGGARGIDSAAHRGALDAGGTTVAVLGCGIDVAYPRQHASLLRRIEASGAVISEYPPGTPAEPFRFPARNRLVAALARAVVVVEGAPGSGSMITAEHALDVGRDVLAVPGAVDSELSAVPLALIREGAALIRGPEDLLADLGIEQEGALAEGMPGSSPGSPPVPSEARASSRPSGSPPASTALPASSGPALPPDQRAVLGALRGPSTADAIASSARLPLPRAVAALVDLELRRLVVASGGRYRRAYGTAGNGVDR